MNLLLHFHALVVPNLISIGFLVVLIRKGFQYRHTPVSTPFIAFGVCFLIWAITSLVELVTLNFRWSLVAADLSFLGTTFFPLAWLALVMYYTGYAERFKRLLPWLLIVPILTNIIILTNPLHRLWRGDSYRDLETTWFPISHYEYQSWYYTVHMPFSYGVAFVALFLLLRSIYFAKRAYRYQILLLVSAFLLTLLIEIAHHLGLQPIPHYNASALTFPISMLLISWGLWGFNLLDVSPIARNVVVENMSNLMLVLDQQQRVVDFNPAAKAKLFPATGKVIGTPIADLLPQQYEQICPLLLDPTTTQEITIVMAENTHIYEVHCSPLHTARHPGRGWALLLSDITLRKQIERDYQAEQRQSTLLEERARVARELHDSVDQMLFSASALAALLPSALSEKPEKTLDYASKIQHLLQGASTEMRLIMLELHPEALVYVDLSQLIKQLCESFTGTTGIEALFTSNTAIVLPEKAQITFYRIAQEALHNCAKYSKASRVHVQFTQEGDMLTLIIEDDGVGFAFESIRSTNLGLRNMAERAESIHAQLNITSQVNQGTKLVLRWGIK